MNLYLLQRLHAPAVKGSLERILIRARSERDARVLAAREDGNGIWENVLHTSCESIVTRGLPGIIIKETGP